MIQPVDMLSTKSHSSSIIKSVKQTVQTSKLPSFFTKLESYQTNYITRFSFGPSHNSRKPEVSLYKLGPCLRKASKFNLPCCLLQLILVQTLGELAPSHSLPVGIGNAISVTTQGNQRSPTMHDTKPSNEKSQVCPGKSSNEKRGLCNRDHYYQTEKSANS